MSSNPISPIYSFWQERPRLFNNPVIKRELIERLRKKSSMLFLFLFLVIMAFMTVSAWDNYLKTYIYTTTFVQLGYFIGLSVFQGIFLFFMLPILSATCINIEFEQESWELLKTTHLSTSSILFAKFLTCLLFIGFLQLALIPFYGVYFIAGGVSPNDILFFFVILLECSTIIILIGMVCSAYFRRTIRSITATYLLAGFYFIYPFLMAFILAEFFDLYVNEPLSFLMFLSPFSIMTRYFGGPFPNQMVQVFPGNSLYYWHATFTIILIAILCFICFKLIHRKSTYVPFSLLSWLGYQSKRIINKDVNWTQKLKFIPDFYNPILHKENKELNSFSSWRNIFIPLSLFLLSLFILWLFVSNSNQPDFEAFATFIFFALPILCIPYSIYAYRSEMDQNSWDLLRTTTLPLEHIMEGKLKAAQRMFRIRFLCFYLLFFIAGFYNEFGQFFRQSANIFNHLDSSPDHNFLIFHVVFFLLAFVWAYMLFNAGMFFSLKMKKTLSAYVTMVLFILGFYFFPIPFLIMLDGFPRSDELIAIFGLISPIFYFVFFWEADKLIAWLLIGIIHVIIMFSMSLFFIRKIRYRLSRID